MLSAIKDRLSYIVSRQPFILGQIGVLLSLAVALGLDVDTVLLDSLVTGFFSVLALFLEVLTWFKITPVAEPRGKYGEPLVPAERTP